MREMLEGLMQHRAPRDNIAELALTSKGETAKFYGRIVSRRDGQKNLADQPSFTNPFEEAGLLRGVIGVTLTALPDQVVIDFNETTWRVPHDAYHTE